MAEALSPMRAVALPSFLDHDGAMKLHQAIGRANGDAITFDASAVETLSLPAVQLLTAATRPGSPIAIVNPSAAYSEAFASLGLECVTSVADLAEGASPMDAALAEPGAAEPGTAGSLRPLRILTIDDSKTMRNMLMLTLAGAGFEVLQAEDGQDGLSLLERETVDLIITDINMPKMDGYGVIEHLRGDPAYDDTPILVLTTESDRDKKQRARDLGATGFIVKPFSPETLVDVIHKVASR